VSTDPLSRIFPESFDTGQVPADWRTANISPIFKKGSTKEPENYRPVSLTSVVCKTMESIVRGDMVTFFDEGSLFSRNQHLFMKKRSCLTNLLETFEEWTKAFDEEYGMDVIYLDYTKAYDSVPNKRLIEILKGYGLHTPYQSNHVDW